MCCIVPGRPSQPASVSEVHHRRPSDELKLADLERLEVRGAVSPARVRNSYGRRAVALPSREEALPMILSEAMAAGRPFVATPVGGVSSLAPAAPSFAVDDDRAARQRPDRALGRSRPRPGPGTAGQMLCSAGWLLMRSTPAYVGLLRLRAHTEADGEATPASRGGRQEARYNSGMCCSLAPRSNR